MRVYVPVLLEVEVGLNELGNREDPRDEALAVVRQLHELNSSFEGARFLVDERSEVRDTLAGPLFSIPVPVDEDNWHDDVLRDAGACVVVT